MADNRLLWNIAIEAEPKRVNRFLMIFPSELGIESWIVESTKRPSAKLNSVAINEMNTTNYVIGKKTVESMNITFKDTISSSSTQKIYEWWNLHHEDASGRQGYAAVYKKDIMLTSLDPVGVDVERWLLLQCMITSYDMGENNYGQDGLQMVKITIQPYDVRNLY